jgi:hypothetical protein
MNTTHTRTFIGPCRLGVIWTLCVLGALCVFCSGVFAQQMPDPKQMSGIPRPVGVNELPNGSVSVRVILGDLSNNIPNQPVELHVGDEVRTATTDGEGRVQFDALPAGTTLKAVTVVDGERLESMEFPAPAQGGIRLMLVATDKEKEQRLAAEAAAPAVTGMVVFGGESRIVIEPGDESVAVYYMLEIMNNQRTRVNPPEPIQFDMPSGSISAVVLQGSSPLASSTGTHVRILGPFPPGKTNVEIAAEIPVTSGTMEIAQTFPATFEQLVVVAKKEGQLKLASPQLDRTQETSVEGTAVIIGAGGAVSPGQRMVFTLSGLPHHSAVPRRVALTLAALIVAAGVLFALRPAPDTTDAGERRKLVARREKLLRELVRVERDHSAGRLDARQHTRRRDELLAALEHVYGALDTDEVALERPVRRGAAVPAT